MGDFENVYLDSSVIVRLTFQQPGALLIDFKSAFASELLEVEVMRALGNRRVTHTLDEDGWINLRSMAVVNMTGIQRLPLDKTVLTRAMSSFPTSIGTLDAIHLSTALLWSENHKAALTFVTHDRQLGNAARACGLTVYP